MQFSDDLSNKGTFWGHPDSRQNVFDAGEPTSVLLQILHDN